MTFHIRPLYQINGLDDLRFAVKSMARRISMRQGLPPGRPGMRRTAEKVIEGTVTCYELEKWYPKAVKILNEKR